jgi:regulator of protease activity HflC (stomatin/prohibitin superfamily)
MSISTLLGFLSLVGWVIAAGGAFLAVSSASRRQGVRSGLILAAVGVLVGILFFLFSAGVVEVAPDQIAVVFQQVGGDPKLNSLAAVPLGPGVHIIVPVLNVPTIYSTRINTYTMSMTTAEGQVGGDDSVKARTKDGQEVSIDVSVLYGISPTAANQIHIKWQNRYENDFVRPTTRSAVRTIIASYSVEEIYGAARSEIQQKIHDLLVQPFNENGLILSDFLIRNVTFSPEYIKAVEAKVVAQQDSERAVLEANKLRTQAKGQADAAVLAAQGDSDAISSRAKGQADATRLAAQAESDALALINAQISKNPALIQYTYIQKLAPDVKLVLIPSNSPFLFDMQSLINQTNAVPATSTTPAVNATPVVPGPTATPTSP